MFPLHTVATLLCLLTHILHVQSIGFHLPAPVLYSHSCSPLGTWAVSGNLTLTEADGEVYSTNLTLTVRDRDVCSLHLENCPELTSSTSSSTSSPNICQCVRYTEDDYGVFIRQTIVQSDVGGTLKAVIPGLPKFTPLQATYDIGNIPTKTSGNLTYQINHGAVLLLTPHQNITTCSGDSVKISVCAPSPRHPGTVLKMTELRQTVTSSDPCIHIMDEFSFKDTDSHLVVFSYDEGAGCPFQEKFVFDIQEKKSGCLQTPQTPVDFHLLTTPALPTTTAAPSPCAETPTSPARLPATLSNGLRVLCDTWTDGGDWIVIQRRTKGDVNFERGWTEYVAGFGDLGGDHWMGLQDVHSICPPSRPCRLRVDLKDINYSGGKLVWAEYSNFSLGGYTEKYHISLAGYDSNSTLADALLYHQQHTGIPFSTYDRDNDNWERNCAATYHAGWWYRSCHYTNLNGLWGVKDNTGLRWYDPSSKKDLFATYSEIKVRMQ